MNDQRIDRLYELPLEEFTAARDALAKELRASDPALAKAVKAMQKPSVPAWGVNQLARREPALLSEVIEAGDALRAAQQTVLAGGDPASLLAAQKAERTALSKALQRAEQILTEAGHAKSAARAERVRDTLHALALDPDAREPITTGRLVREVGYAGIGAEGDLAAVIQMPVRPKAAPPAKDDPERERRLQEAREESERLAKVAREAADEAERLADEADRAAREAEDARAMALEARKASTRARREAEATAEALKRMERTR